MVIDKNELTRVKVSVCFFKIEIGEISLIQRLVAIMCCRLMSSHHHKIMGSLRFSVRTLHKCEVEEECEEQHDKS